MMIGSRAALRDSDTKSLSGAYAIKAKSIAGRIRFLYEMAVGHTAVDGEAPVVPLNPDGQLGVNFSGPPFGSAWRHPLFWAGGCKPNVSGTVTGQRSVGAVATGAPLTWNIRYRSRNFAAGERVPYSRAYLHVRAFRTAGTSFTVNVQFDNGDGTPARADSFTCSSTTETAFDLTNAYWNVSNGGGEQNLRVVFSIASAASACTIAAISGYQRAKRVHT